MDETGLTNPLSEREELSDLAHPEAIYIRLTDGGYIRKWDTKPFPGGVQYLRSLLPCGGDLENERAPASPSAGPYADRECTCRSGRDFDGSEFGPCEHCEEYAWREANGFTDDDLQSMADNQPDLEELCLVLDTTSIKARTAPSDTKLGGATATSGTRSAATARKKRRWRRSSATASSGKSIATSAPAAGTNSAALRQAALNASAASAAANNESPTQ